MKSQVAKVLVNIPLDSSFDYSVPKDLQKKIKVGSRIWVNFINKRKLAYVIGLSDSSKIKKLKPVMEVIDSIPIFNSKQLAFLKDLSEYYCCSFSEMIEAALPAMLRKGKEVELGATANIKKSPKEKFKATLLKGLSDEEKQDFIVSAVKRQLGKKKDIIFLVPEISLISHYYKMLVNSLKEEVAILHSKQSDKEELASWLKISSGKIRIVLGTRLAVFTPLKNIGLIIVEDESNSSYKQDQVPHYNAREVAFMLARRNKAQIVLSSLVPSVESFNKFKNKTLSYSTVKGKDWASPKINLLDVSRIGKGRKEIISAALENAIRETLSNSGKVLILMNRKGFSTYLRCQSCGFVLRCQRCSSSLAYHFDQKKLFCPFCNYKSEPITICPKCNSSYIRYLGVGIEKLESELNRIFPQARISIWKENIKIENNNVIIATQTIMHRQLPILFDLVVALQIESLLNRVDFRAAEKTFSMLWRLAKLAEKQLIIQTRNAAHYCLQALYNNKPEDFYRSEISARKALDFPPLSHFIQIKLRGKNETKTATVAQLMFDKLVVLNKIKGTVIFEPVIANPSKLRGYYYWNVLVKTKSVLKANRLIRQVRKSIKSKSGVIITVNVDL